MQARSARLQQRSRPSDVDDPAASASTAPVAGAIGKDTPVHRLPPVFRQCADLDLGCSLLCSSVRAPQWEQHTSSIRPTAAIEYQLSDLPLVINSPPANMATADVTMTDAAPAAAAAALPSPAAPSSSSSFTFHCSHLPSSGTLHLAYLRDLTAEQLKQLKAQSGDGKEFALINADHVSGTSRERREKRAVNGIGR
jgi:hypothetical protein